MNILRSMSMIAQTVLFAGLSCSSMALAAEETAPATTNVILSNKSTWRCYFGTRAPLVRIGQDLKKVFLISGGVWTLPKDGKTPSSAGDMSPPATWSAAEFNDQSWVRSVGPFFPSAGWAYTKEVDGAGFCGYEDITPNLALICLRGKFRVVDPAAAGTLKLSLSYRGGVVVYLNGREITRASIPDTEKAKGLEALAEDYPKEAYVTDKGKLIRSTWGDPQKYLSQLQSRIRKLHDIVLPAKLLRKGVNVVAIETHRAPYHEATHGKSGMAHHQNTRGYILDWVTVGLPNVELTATGTGVSPNLTRPAGFQVWNQDSLKRVNASDYGDPCEPLRPIHLVCARNGVSSGQVVLGSSTAIRGLKAGAGALTGPGKIPAANIQVRYALEDKDTKLASEILSTDAPAEMAPHKQYGGAVVPVWITVRVPTDAKPGDYTGTLTITVDGSSPVNVPVQLHVANWKLPDPKEFVSHVGLTQSPETLAMKYNVPLWSEEHWRLVEQSFELLAQVGADDLFITALRRTHHGNEHGMIRWIKQPDGAIKPDLSIAERYLDLAIKHLGKIPVVCVYCWEPYTGARYMGGAMTKQKGMFYSLLDPATGKLEEKEGPQWGTPEVREFWKPVFDGMLAILKKRGMEGSLMIGVSNDSIPGKEAVDDLKAAAPSAGWVGQSHGKTSNLYGTPVAYYAEVWNSPSPPDPTEQRVYGWKLPRLLTVFPRYNTFTLMRTHCTLAQYRVASESASVSGIRGYSRVGADFWNVLEKANSTYGKGHNIIARYPESDWGQLYLGNSTPYVIAPGPRGPLATARFEMLRLGAQDLEARMFLEKALLDTALRARLGEDLVRRSQDLLDRRVLAILTGRPSWKFFQDAPERENALYALVAEAAGKLGK